MADELAQGGKWRVTGSRYVHKDRWIAVRADDCVTEDGVSVAPYYVLEYPDWVEIVALDADDNLLLVRQYRHGVGDQPMLFARAQIFVHSRLLRIGL